MIIVMKLIIEAFLYLLDHSFCCPCLIHLGVYYSSLAQGRTGYGRDIMIIVMKLVIGQDYNSIETFSIAHLVF